MPGMPWMTKSTWKVSDNRCQSEGVSQYGRGAERNSELAVIFGAVTVCSSLADAVRVSALTSATPLAAECYWPLAAVAVK